MKEALGYLVNSKRRRMISEQQTSTEKSADLIFWLQIYLQNLRGLPENMYKNEAIDL